MALPDKRLPLIHYDTKAEYEARVAEMTTEERAQYNAFFLGFVAETREFHAKGNTYKCGREWLWANIAVAQEDTNDFVNNVCAGDTLLLSGSELVLITSKTIGVNTIVVTAIAPSGERSMTFTTTNNGVTWQPPASIVSNAFVTKTPISSSSSVGCIGIGAIYEEDQGFLYAFPSSSDEVKNEADYVLQERIDDINEIRENANNAVQESEVSMNIIPETIVRRDGNGIIAGKYFEDGQGIMYAMPYSSDEDKAEADYVLQERIDDIEEIRAGATAGKMAIPRPENQPHDEELLMWDEGNDSVKGAGFERDSIMLKYEPTATRQVIGHRTTNNGGKVLDNSASIKAVYGNSVVWNNIISNGNFKTSDKWESVYGTFTVGDNRGVFTLNYAAQSARIQQSINIIGGHTYYVTATFKSSVDTRAQILLGGAIMVMNQIDIKANTPYTFTDIITINSDSTSILLYCNMSNSMQVGDTCEYSDISIVDLTRMFGAGNEPATVEEFSQYIGNTMMQKEFDELQILDPSWNGDRCNVVREDTTLIVTSTATGTIDIYNLTPLVGGHKYYYNVGVKLPHTDTVVIGTPVNGNAQYRQVAQANVKTTLETIVECTDDYSVFYIYPNWQTGALGEIYEIYQPIVIDLTEEYGEGNEPATLKDLYEKLGHDTSHFYDEGTLRNFMGNRLKIKSSDSSGEIVSVKSFDLSTIFPNGIMRSAGSVKDELRYDTTKKVWKAIQRVGVVDLGSLTWSAMSSASSSVKIKYALLDLKAEANNVIGNITTEKYTPSTADNVYLLKSDKTIAAAYHATGNYISVYDSEYPTAADASSFKAAMQGVMLNYELAEPIVTEIPYLDSFYDAYQNGVEEIVSYDSPSTPLIADIAYQYDARGKIDFIYSKIKSL